MKNDGTDLEELVAFVERTLRPEGGTVEKRKRLFTENGVQEVEFDVEVRGKLGSMDVACLIECRDRPSQGAAPASWIRELSGKGKEYGFNKVIAVSTTGFAEPAENSAATLGVELRTVNELSANAFTWLAMTEFPFFTRTPLLTAVRTEVSVSAPPELQKLAREIIRGAKSNEAILKSSKTGEVFTADAAFRMIVDERALFDKVVPNGPEVAVGPLWIEYVNDEDHFVIETPNGDVRIRAIEYTGTLRIEVVNVPLDRMLEYCGPDGSPISQVAIFAAHPVLDVMTRMEMHHLPNSGTHVVLRQDKKKVENADG